MRKKYEIIGLMHLVTDCDYMIPKSLKFIITMLCLPINKVIISRFPGSIQISRVEI